MVRDAGFALAALAAGTMLPRQRRYASPTTPEVSPVFDVRRARLSVGSVLTYFVGLYFGWKVLEPLGFFNVEVKRS
jgi:hypothetical protein